MNVSHTFHELTYERMVEQVDEDLRRHHEYVVGLELALPRLLVPEVEALAVGRNQIAVVLANLERDVLAQIVRLLVDQWHVVGEKERALD